MGCAAAVVLPCGLVSGRPSYRTLDLAYGLVLIRGAQWWSPPRRGFHADDYVHAIHRQRSIILSRGSDCEEHADRRRLSSNTIFLGEIAAAIERSSK